MTVIEDLVKQTGSSENTMRHFIAAVRTPPHHCSQDRRGGCCGCDRRRVIRRAVASLFAIADSAIAGKCASKIH
ncbi:MAG: hypothetical protein JSR61_21040 [Proteobacteria bacterium]|nr:hypothetical protein [Pseudomonadota bacterium]